jgi:hypothetical protein
MSDGKVVAGALSAEEWARGMLASMFASTCPAGVDCEVCAARVSQLAAALTAHAAAACEAAERERERERELERELERVRPLVEAAERWVNSPQQDERARCNDLLVEALRLDDMDGKALARWRAERAADHAPAPTGAAERGEPAP